MKRIAVVVGGLTSVITLSAFEDVLEGKGFEVVRSASFNEATDIVKKRKVALMLVYAYGNRYSTLIDAYSGKLPPIVYWYIMSVDTLPKSVRKLHALPSAVLIDDFIKAVDTLLKK